MSKQITLGGSYYFQTLSQVLDADSMAAGQLGPEMEDIRYKLMEMARHAEMLEDLAQDTADYKKKIEVLEEDNEDLKELLSSAKEDVLELEDTIKEAGGHYHSPRIDNEARNAVETSLHEDGIIEDPDVDGGLLG